MNVKVLNPKVFEESKNALKAYSHNMQEFFTKLREDIAKTEQSLHETENKMTEKLSYYKTLQVVSAGATAAGIYTTMVFVIGIGTISLAVLIDKEKKLHKLLEELKSYKAQFDMAKNNLLNKVESFEDFLTKDVTHMSITLKHFEECINDYLAMKTRTLGG